MFLDFMELLVGCVIMSSGEFILKSVSHIVRAVHERDAGWVDGRVRGFAGDDGGEVGRRCLRVARSGGMNNKTT